MFDFFRLVQIACSLPPLPIIAKIKYLPNNFQIIDSGDYVICAVSGKKINIENLTYWNVELQEPYFSYKEAFQKREENKKK